MFKTTALTPERGPGNTGINVKCLHLEWNEPYATLFENDKDWFLKQEKLEEEYGSSAENIFDILLILSPLPPANQGGFVSVFGKDLNFPKMLLRR